MDWKVDLKQHERIIESIKRQTSDDIVAQVLEQCGEIDHNATPAKQTSYVVELINAMDSVIDEQTRAAIMNNCGGQCIPDRYVATAQNAYKESSSIDEFLDKLNKLGLGGGSLKRDGSVIRGYYDECYCRLVKRAKKPVSLTYCNCSAGWYKKLFESALGRSVEVKVIDSVVHGADRCEFEIKLSAL